MILLCNNFIFLLCLTPDSFTRQGKRPRKVMQQRVKSFVCAGDFKNGFQRQLSRIRFTFQDNLSVVDVPKGIKLRTLIVSFFKNLCALLFSGFYPTVHFHTRLYSKGLRNSSHSFLHIVVVQQLLCNVVQQQFYSV